MGPTYGSHYEDCAKPGRRDKMRLKMGGGRGMEWEGGEGGREGWRGGGREGERDEERTAWEGG